MNKQIKRPWTKQQERELSVYSEVRKPVAIVARIMKRTPGALRQKAFALGLPLGHRQHTRH